MKKETSSFLKGIIAGVVAATLVIPVFSIAAGQMFKLKNGTSYEIVNLALGSVPIPRSQLPDGMPALKLDGRTYVPLRGVVDAANGDVGWDSKTNTASINACNTIIAFSGKEPVDVIHKQNSDISFMTSIPAKMLSEYTKYEYMCIVEYAGKFGTETYGDSVISNFTVNQNEGYTLSYSTSYNYMNVGKHTFILKIRKAGTANWTIAAKRVFNIG